MKLWGAVLHIGFECVGSYDKVANSLEGMKAILEADGFSENSLFFYEKYEGENRIIAAFIELDYIEK